MENIYRKKLEESYSFLEEFHMKLFEHIVNIGMEGDLKSINDSFGEGQILKLEIDHFRNSSDANLEMLVGLSDSIDSILDSLGNLNNLKK